MLSLLNHVQGLKTGDQFLGTPKRFEPRHRIYDAFDLPMVLLDNVVEALRLAQFNVQAGIIIDILDSSGVGATFAGHLDVVSSIRQLVPAWRLWRRKRSAMTGRIFQDQRCTVEGPHRRRVPASFLPDGVDLGFCQSSGCFENAISSFDWPRVWRTIGQRRICAHI